MRILRVAQNNLITPQAFLGRRAESKETRGKERASKRADFPDGKMPYSVNYGVSVLRNQRTAKSLHPFSEGYFDMEKLLSLNVEEAEQTKPLSFEDSHAKFTLDRYQKEAIDSFVSGKTTVVSAPTGTGKTLIAEHVIKDALDNGRKIIYLSPLKALSNEKYTEFSKLFGRYDENGDLRSTENVGLMTGDSTINPDAPLMVMTTEIYRNSLLTSTEEEADEMYKNYDGVVYDEFHYLGDKQRGTVWEESVMNTPKHMKQLMLSATASNAGDIMNWVGEINPRIVPNLVNVPESERHVPLKEYVLTATDEGKLKLEETKIQKIDMHRLENRINLSDRQIKAFEEMKEIIGAEDDNEAIAFLRELAGRRNELKCDKLASELVKCGAEKDKADGISLVLSNKNSTTYKKEPENGYASNAVTSKVVKLLNDKKMTPALFYIFSKKGCNKELEKAAEHSESLLTPEESRRVYDEVQKAKEKGVFLGEDFDDKELEALMKGFAVHHAGRLPAYKSLVENLARQGLVKACFATETLIAGINMPFKTTVFTSLEKFDGDEVVDITPQIFKQGGGRAGRRGKDEVGNVIVMAKTQDDYDKYLALTRTSDTSIRSQYQISYASLLSDRMLNNVDDVLLGSLAAYQSGSKLERCEKTAENKLELLKSFGYVEQAQDGKLQRTEKGDIAKRVFGINEILLTELLSEPQYLKDFTSKELIALCASFSDVKDENPSRDFKGDLKYMQEPMEKIFNLADEVNQFEFYYNLDDNQIKASTSLVPYVLDFAEAPFEREESLQNWRGNMAKMKEKELLAHEGDFLRIVNGTVDILKLICELSPDENIRNEASIAMEALRKPPVLDIFNYELNKEN